MWIIFIVTVSIKYLIQYLFIDLSYNIALCYYSMKQYAPALKHIADIIEKGIREHPGIEMDLEWFGLSMQLPDKSLIVYGAVERCYGQFWEMIQKTGDKFLVIFGFEPRIKRREK